MQDNFDRTLDTTASCEQPVEFLLHAHGLWFSGCATSLHRDEAIFAGNGVR